MLDVNKINERAQIGARQELPDGLFSAPFVKTAALDRHYQLFPSSSLSPSPHVSLFFPFFLRVHHFFFFSFFWRMQAEVHDGIGACTELWSTCQRYLTFQGNAPYRKATHSVFGTKLSIA